MTPASLEALANLRSADHFQWYVVPMFSLVLFVYFNEIEKRNWNLVLAGLAFYSLEWLIELINGLWLHFSQYSAIWTAPASSAFLITVGLNIEITLMFAIAGVGFAKILPTDRTLKIMGINNRIVFALANSVFCVLVEIVLNHWNALIWAYPWWNWYNPILIVIFGYSLYMFFSFWVYDHPSMRTKITAIAAVTALDIVGYAVFMGLLGWV
jgi:hypothetical protein